MAARGGGQINIRNCTFVPSGGSLASVNLIGGYNSGQHNFGYTCYMPEHITIENLHIDDSNLPKNYRGPALFSNFNPKMTDDSYHEQFPYARNKKVILRNITTDSGKTLIVCDNLYMFKDLKVVAD